MMEDKTITDSGNSTLYAITCDQIRDFCGDALRSGRLPSDKEVDSLLWEYTIREDSDQVASL